MRGGWSCWRQQDPGSPARSPRGRGVGLVHSTVLYAIGTRRSQLVLGLVGALALLFARPALVLPLHQVVVRRSLRRRLRVSDARLHAAIARRAEVAVRRRRGEVEVVEVGE